MKNASIMLLAGLALVPLASAHQTEKFKLLPSDGAPGDNFGFAVGMDVDTLVVGAPLADNPGINTGAAYVFTVTGTTWTEQAKLNPSWALAGDNFGRSVAVSGNVIVVGAPLHQARGPRAGSVFIFERSGTVWSEVAQINASDGQADDEFGQSVSISGSTIVVGTPQADKIYVITKNGGTWSEDAILTGSDTLAGDLFGYSVSVDGDSIVVGAPTRDELGTNSGACYVFDRSGTTWSESAKLTHGGGQATDLFGFSVAIKGNQIYAGAPFTDGPFPNQLDTGSAYEFLRSGNVWTEVKKYVHFSPSTGDRLGNAVAIAGIKLLAASSMDDEGANHGVPPPLNSGSTHEFYCVPGVPPPPIPCFDILVASDAEPGDQLGISVTGTMVWYVLGAMDDDNGTDAGAVYAFLSPRHWSYCTAKVNSCGGTPKITHTKGGYATASETSGFPLVSTGANEGKIGLLLYSDAGRRLPAAPFPGGGFLCVNAPIGRTVALVASGGTPGLCDSSFSIDMNAFAHGLLGGNPKPYLLVPGTAVGCQFWGRDTVQNGIYVTEAWEYKVIP